MKNEKRLDILFAMNTLDDLGIQRAIVWILNEWNEDRYGTVALSLHKKEGKLKDFLSPNVKVFEIDKIVKPIKHLGFFCRLFSYYFLLKKIRPQKIIAVNQGEGLALCLVKRFYRNFRLIISEHCHVSSNISGADAHKGWFGWYYRNFFSREYNKYADIVHTVSYEAADDLIKKHGIIPEKVRVIYNPVDFEVVRKKAEEKIDESWLKEGYNTVVAVSRLTSQKRLDILLKAWQLVKKTELGKNNENSYRLLICGDGPLRKELENLVYELGLKESVKFLGFQANPWKYIKRAKLFVNTSEWEGLSCSLIEAQALGIPIVASDCPSGNKEILMDGEAGLLFENKNIEDCAQKIMEAFDNYNRALEKAHVAGYYLSRFNLAKIIEEYSML